MSSDVVSPPFAADNDVNTSSGDAGGGAASSSAAGSMMSGQEVSTPTTKGGGEASLGVGTAAGGGTAAGAAATVTTSPVAASGIHPYYANAATAQQHRMVSSTPYGRTPYGAAAMYGVGPPHQPGPLHPYHHQQQHQQHVQDPAMAGFYAARGHSYPHSHAPHPQYPYGYGVPPHPPPPYGAAAAHPHPLHFHHQFQHLPPEMYHQNPYAAYGGGLHMAPAAVVASAAALSPSSARPNQQTEGYASQQPQPSSYVGKPPNLPTTTERGDSTNKTTKSNTIDASSMTGIPNSGQGGHHTNVANLKTPPRGRSGSSADGIDDGTSTAAAATPSAGGTMKSPGTADGEVYYGEVEADLAALSTDGGEGCNDDDNGDGDLTTTTTTSSPAQKKAAAREPQPTQIVTLEDLNITKWYMGCLPLGLEDDKYWLSELQVYLRANFAEVFSATDEDIAGTFCRHHLFRPTI
jgi:hypothetical protein